MIVIIVLAILFLYSLCLHLWNIRYVRNTLLWIHRSIGIVVTFFVGCVVWTAKVLAPAANGLVAMVRGKRRSRLLTK